MISPNQSILPQWILNHQILMNPPSSSAHHHLPPHPPPCYHLPRSIQLGPVQVDASEEQVACGGQGNSDHHQLTQGGRARTTHSG